MTLEEYEEIINPTPIQLCLADLKKDEKFYFSHKGYDDSKPYKIYFTNNDNKIHVGEVQYFHDYGHHNAEITVRRA